MHPAPSVIVFTVLSGLGFGLLFFLGLGLPTVTGWAAFFYYALGFGLAGVGLLSSTLHLGNPQRAWRAFSQWRSSWLSREAVLSVAALSILGVHGAAAVFLGRTLDSVGYLGAVFALATVVATAMIYGQLRTVPRWNQWLTPVLFVVAMVTGGAILAGQTAVALALLPLLLLA
ncbi:MAG: DmsC/YnfH family molybdoenzyme membrane anchor subunit, partial [Pseudomonadota bacterium]